MQRVDGRFACHIMNTHSRPSGHLHDVDSTYVRCWSIFCICIHNEKCYMLANIFIIEVVNLDSVLKMLTPLHKLAKCPRLRHSPD
jgi:hypothetical protein